MLTPLFWKRVGLSFLRAFLATLMGQALVIWTGLAENISDGVIDWNAGLAVLFAAIAAAITAGVRAAQAAFTTLETDPRLKAMATPPASPTTMSSSSRPGPPR